MAVRTDASLRMGILLPYLGHFTSKFSVSPNIKIVFFNRNKKINILIKNYIFIFEKYQDLIPLSYIFIDSFLQILHFTV